MAFVIGILLMYLEQQQAFAAFVTLMSAAQLRSLYLPGMAALQLRLRQLGELLRRRSPALARHLEGHDVSPVIYASSWLLTLYAAEFPWTFSARLLDVCLAERSAAAMLRVALGLLDAAEPQLLALGTFEAIVVYLKVTVKDWPAERLREILTRAQPHQSQSHSQRHQSQIANRSHAAAVSLHMEGVDDASLDNLAAEIARADARGARPAASDGADSSEALLCEGDEAPPEGRIRTRSSSVIEILLELDLGARISPRAGEGDGEGGLGDWEEIEAPMSGLGTRTEVEVVALEEGGESNRPSLAMLGRERAGEGGAKSEEGGKKAE
jgi:hypothetical protein